MNKKLVEMAAELLNMANETKMEEIENQGATIDISSNQVVSNVASKESLITKDGIKITDKIVGVMRDGKCIDTFENKAPQVEAEELVELMVGNHEIMFLRVTPDGNKLYSIKYSTQN